MRNGAIRRIKCTNCILHTLTPLYSLSHTQIHLWISIRVGLFSIFSVLTFLNYKIILLPFALLNRFFALFADFHHFLSSFSIFLVFFTLLIVSHFFSDFVDLFHSHSLLFLLNNPFSSFLIPLQFINLLLALFNSYLLSSASFHRCMCLCACSYAN